MSKFVEYAKGDPMNPLSTAELMNKFEKLAFGRPDARSMYGAIEQLHEANGTRHVLEMLCQGKGA